MTDRDKIIASLKHFSPATDRGISWDKVDVDSLVRLDAAREIAQTPFVITSNYRTPEHSVQVHGLKDDAHTEAPCAAYDILCKRNDGKFDSQAAFKIIKALLQVGFVRMGVNSNGHVHCDGSPVLPQQVFWIEG